MLNQLYPALNGCTRSFIICQGVRFLVVLTYRPLRGLRNLSPQVTCDLNDVNVSIRVPHTATEGLYLGLEDIDFGRGPSHVGTVRVDRTWMRFTLTRAPAQPLARQVGQNIVVTGITTLERSFGEAIMRLILEGTSFC